MALERLAATGTLLFGSAVILIHALAGPEQADCDLPPSFGEAVFACNENGEYVAHFADGSIATYVAFDSTGNYSIQGLVMLRAANGTMYVASWDANKDHNQPLKLEKFPESEPSLDSENQEK